MVAALNALCRFIPTAGPEPNRFAKLLFWSQIGLSPTLNGKVCISRGTASI